MSDDSKNSFTAELGKKFAVTHILRHISRHTWVSW